jgi:hypothetical protein
MSKEINTPMSEYHALALRDQGVHDDANDSGAYEYAEEPEDRPYIGPWVVSMFLIDQAYGGGEEGGWWYTYGDPVLTSHVRVFTDINEAHAYVDSLDDELARMNEGRPKISDTNSIGRFDARICEGWPKAFPDQIPRYE